MAGENIRKIKIVVLGDPGVGKSSFVHQVCHSEVLSSPSSTVGCSIEVKLHEYTRSLATKSTDFFVELWDMGSSTSHEKGRSIFYSQTDGLILVHDLTNRKSHTNLFRWLSEFYSGVSEKVTTDRRDSLKREYDAEQFADQELPTLIVGTREDQVSGRRSPPSSIKGRNMSGATSISLDCRSLRHFSVDSQQFIEIMRFIDKVIEHKYYPGIRP